MVQCVRTTKIGICFSTLVMLFLAQSLAFAQAQSTDEQFYIIGYMDERVTFYGYTDVGTLAEVGSLPSNFSVRDLNPAAEWIIDSRLHLSISPDGQYIAFTARRDAEAALFIYTVADATLEQTPVVSSALIPLWSPDSEALILRPLTPIFEPSPFPETFVYERTTGTLSQITESPNFIETVIRWLTDSSGIVYATRCESPCGWSIEDIYLSDREGNSQVRLTDLTSALPEGIYGIDTCNMAWSSLHDRLYYEVGCFYLGDRPQDYVFSTDLMGNNHLEFVTETAFADEAIIARDVVGISSASNGLFLALQNSIVVAVDWYIIRVSDIGQYDVIFQQTFENDNWSELQHAVFSPDSSKAVLIGEEVFNQNKPIIVIDTVNDQIIFQQTVMKPNAVCGVHWIDSWNFVYEETRQGCGLEADVIAVWLVDTTAETVTNVSEDIPHLIGLLRQPDKLPAFVGVGEQTTTPTPAPDSTP